ncbi:DUF6152 family protein [Pseudomonas sp. Ant30-3]|uniref:DUF6152 family protein n=1 Tax=Pseudomonas sp. Ant30-3 TaxID=1488328 RepID=UPI00048AA312|nr:DUF6152 family protein [Pseudomonas sp. Ant30-3]
MKGTLGGIALAALLTATAAFAHHGWSEYDSKNELELKGTIEETGYSHPHGLIKFKTTEKTWNVVLAPPSRMENRGLSPEMLRVGQKATVVGYPNHNNADELRAERISIDDKTIELR